MPELSEELPSFNITLSVLFFFYKKVSLQGSVTDKPSAAGRAITLAAYPARLSPSQRHKGS